MACVYSIDNGKTYLTESDFKNYLKNNLEDLVSGKEIDLSKFGKVIPKSKVSEITKPTNQEELATMLEKRFGRNSELAQAEAQLFDLRADVWSNLTGRPKSEFYDRVSYGEEKSDEGLNQVEAYHGSPYSFDKFTTDKIGTGEGAQAFGWGLYFTDLKGIAISYAKMRDKSENKFLFNGKKIENDKISDAFYELDRHGYQLNVKNIKKELKNYIQVQLEDTNDAQEIKDYKEALLILKNSEITLYSPSRNLYAVTLHEGKKPSEYIWLEWDKPITKSNIEKIKNQFSILDKQRKEREENAFKEARTHNELINKREETIESWLNSDDANKGIAPPNIDSINKKIEESYNNLSDDIEKSGKNKSVGVKSSVIYRDLRLKYQDEIELYGDIIEGDDVKDIGDFETASDFYKSLSDNIGAKEASLFLLESGIDGIKYPAESISRGATSDTARGFNYVVFDENAVSIKEKELFQKKKGNVQGQIKFTDKVKGFNNAVMSLFKTAKADTFVHEFSHLNFQDMLAMAKDNEQIKADVKTAIEFYNQHAKPSERIKNVDEAVEYLLSIDPSNHLRDDTYVKVHEAFANGFVEYLRNPDSNIPTALKEIYEVLKKYLADLAQYIAGSQAKLTPEMEAVYRRLFEPDFVNNLKETAENRSVEREAIEMEQPIVRYNDDIAKDAFSNFDTLEQGDRPTPHQVFKSKIEEWKKEGKTDSTFVMEQLNKLVDDLAEGKNKEILKDFLKTKRAEYEELADGKKNLRQRTRTLLENKGLSLDDKERLIQDDTASTYVKISFKELQKNVDEVVGSLTYEEVVQNEEAILDRIEETTDPKSLPYAIADYQAKKLKKGFDYLDELRRNPKKNAKEIVELENKLHKDLATQLARGTAAGRELAAQKFFDILTPQILVENIKRQREAERTEEQKAKLKEEVEILKEKVEKGVANEEIHQAIVDELEAKVEVLQERLTDYDKQISKLEAKIKEDKDQSKQSVIENLKERALGKTKNSKTLKVDKKELRKDKKSELKTKIQSFIDSNLYSEENPESPLQVLKEYIENHILEQQTELAKKVSLSDMIKHFEEEGLPIPPATIAEAYKKARVRLIQEGVNRKAIDADAAIDLTLEALEAKKDVEELKKEKKALQDKLNAEKRKEKARESANTWAKLAEKEARNDERAEEAYQKKLNREIEVTRLKEQKLGEDIEEKRILRAYREQLVNIRNAKIVQNTINNIKENATSEKPTSNKVQQTKEQKIRNFVANKYGQRLNDEQLDIFLNSSDGEGRSMRDVIEDVIDNEQILADIENQNKKDEKAGIEIDKKRQERAEKRQAKADRDAKIVQNTISNIEQGVKVPQVNKTKAPQSEAEKIRTFVNKNFGQNLNESQLEAFLNSTDSNGRNMRDVVLDMMQEEKFLESRDFTNQSNIDKIISEAVKGVKWKDRVVKYDRDAAEKEVVDKVIENNPDLSDAEKQAIEQRVKNLFREKTKQWTANQIDRVKRKGKPKKKRVLGNNIIKLANLISTGNFLDGVNEALAEELGLAGITNDQRTQIISRMDVIKSLPHGTLRDNAIEDLSAYIMSITNPQMFAHNIWTSTVYTEMLSNIVSSAQNATGLIVSFEKAITDTLLNADATYLKNFFLAFNKGMLRSALQKGYFKSNEHFDLAQSEGGFSPFRGSEYAGKYGKNLDSKRRKFLAKYRSIKTTYLLGKYITRLNEGIDNISYASTSESAAYKHIKKLVKRENPTATKEEIENMVYERMFPIKPSEARAMAIKDLNESAVTLSFKSIPTEAEIKRVAFDIMQQARDEETKEIMERESLKATYRNKPSAFNKGGGVVEGFSAAYEWAMSGAKNSIKNSKLNQSAKNKWMTALNLSKILMLPFNRTPANIIEVGTHYAVLGGAFKIASLQAYKKGLKGTQDISIETEREYITQYQKDVAVRMAKGAALLTILPVVFAMLNEDKDDDELKDGVYGNSKNNPTKIKNSVVVGGKIIPLNFLGALSPMLAVLGAKSDLERDKKYTDVSDESVKNDIDGIDNYIDATINWMLSVVKSTSFYGTSRTVEIVSDFVNNKGKEGIGKMIGTQLAYSYLPSPRMINDVISWEYTKTPQPHGFVQGMIRGTYTPALIAMGVSKPMFDNRGREIDIRDKSFMSVGGVYKRLASEPNDKYDNILLNHKIMLPFMKAESYLKNGRELTPDEFYKFSKGVADKYNQMITNTSSIPKEYYIKNEEGETEKVNVHGLKYILSQIKRYKNMSMDELEQIGSADLQADRELYKAIMDNYRTIIKQQMHTSGIEKNSYSNYEDRMLSEYEKENLEKNKKELRYNLKKP